MLLRRPLIQRTLLTHPARQHNWKSIVATASVKGLYKVPVMFLGKGRSKPVKRRVRTCFLSNCFSYYEYVGSFHNIPHQHPVWGISIEKQLQEYAVQNQPELTFVHAVLQNARGLLSKDATTHSQCRKKPTKPRLPLSKKSTPEANNI